MSSQWTHRICERCWFDGPPKVASLGALFYGGYEPIYGVLEDGVTFRKPTQIKGEEGGVCCFCGGMTVTAIYVRQGAATLRCGGNHDDPTSWARVGLGPAPEEKP